MPKPEGSPKLERRIVRLSNFSNSVFGFLSGIGIRGSDLDGESWRKGRSKARKAFQKRSHGELTVLALAALFNFLLDHATAADWQPCPSGRCLSLTVAKPGKTGFTEIPASASGIVFSNALPDTVGLTHHILQDGSGVAAGDVDADGWCDLYFCAINGTNRLYRNLGNWRFEDITERAGVGCAGLHSTGATFADLDGDGDLDLVVNTAGNGTSVFLNDGHGHFTPAQFVLNRGKGGESLALADTDGDGYLDLYVVNYRLSALMDSLDGGRFTFKVVDGKQTVATFNGRPVSEPDLADRFTIGPQGDFQENGEPDVLYRNLGGTKFEPVPFTGGNFLDEEGKPLAKPPLDWGLAAMFRDINGDGLPDLYVCNDFQSPDRFWINLGNNKFRLLPRLAQRKSSLSSMSIDFADLNRDGLDDFLVVDMMSRQHSQRMRVLTPSYMPSHPIGYFEDRPQYEMNTLFLNRGDGTFAEIAQLAGVEASEWAWSCIFLDVDLDGWEDMLVVNGMERDGRDLDMLAKVKQLRAKGQPSEAEILQARRMFPRQADGNLAFRNRGNLTFEEVSKAWGFDWKGVSPAMALADLDNDGDLDLVVNTLNGPALVYRNDSTAPRIAVRLKGLPPNTKGIGARIAVSGGALPVQTQEMICGGRYLSGDDTMRVFAAGSETNRLIIDVTWRSGRRSIVTNVMPNSIYEVDEAGASAPQNLARRFLSAAASTASGAVEHSDPVEHSGVAADMNVRAPVRPLFEDVSDRLGHVHHEEPFDDFIRQPLLPNKLGQMGPGVAWFDLDGDGHEDLIIGSGKGGRLAVYYNDGQGAFKPISGALFDQLLPRDQSGIVVWREEGKAGSILAGSANYEEGKSAPSRVQQYDLAGKAVEDIVTDLDSSIGPLALADIDGSGNLELFVGGRVIAGHYPKPASSQIYRHRGASWQLDEQNTRMLEKIGLVSGAVWSDLDGDGFPELILACEWGPIRIFHNDHGRLVAWNPKVLSTLDTGHSTLSDLTGWWIGITAGDFDGDGRMDLVAGNWGRNTKYEAHRERPLAVYYGDFAGDGTVQILEAHFEPYLQKMVPERQLNPLLENMPFLGARFSSHLAFSTASIEEVLGDRLRLAKNLQANCLESTVFLNRGDHFEAHALPVETQFAPVFGICAGDFDGDGNEDLFLAQNFFSTQPETPRYDAGRGVVLLGDGKGEFRPVAGQESGIKVYGEQRGAAVGDFDGDGRVDLVVTQNGAATKLYRNARGMTGLRVRLKGQGGNPDGLGAVIRLKFGDRWGAAREMHGGSGYWSQDSVVQVMGTLSEPAAIQVRWPGGKITTNAVPAHTKELLVGIDGSLHSISKSVKSE